MNKEKIGLSWSRDVVMLEEQNRERLGFLSRSEFVKAAIREYVGRDILSRYADKITKTYQSLERTELKNLEERLAKLSYKIAVELAQINLILSDFSELSCDEAKRLRGKAVRLVNESHGFVDLPSAFLNRRGDGSDE